MREIEQFRMFHVLDDKTLDRMSALYTAVLEDAEIYAEQLRRWQATDLTLGERNVVDQLGRQVQVPRAEPTMCLPSSSGSVASLVGHRGWVPRIQCAVRPSASDTSPTFAPDWRASLYAVPVHAPRRGDVPNARGLSGCTVQ